MVKKWNEAITSNATMKIIQYGIKGPFPNIWFKEYDIQWKNVKEDFVLREYKDTQFYICIKKQI